MAHSPPDAAIRSRPTPPVAVANRDRLGAPLPVPLTSFVGRAREAEAVAELLCRPDVRLVTLTGPGGVGKTRLALRVAADVDGDFPDGGFFVPLAAIAEADLVPPTVARALDATESGDRAPLQRLTDVLRASRILLVLDNFEHVVEAAPFVAELLAACPGLTILATSRTPLRVSGEHEFSVPPLAVPDLGSLPPVDELPEYGAVALFTQRARAVRTDFSVGDDNAAALAALCVRLDGLPLAIELAAARVKILSPQAMLSRLDHRLALLTGGAVDQPPRLRSMRDAIAWSHDLLSNSERVLFRRLVVFVGGCGLEAVGAVTADDGGPDVLEGIAALVDKSLLVQHEDASGEPRFAMLETIREFGRDQLDAAGEGPRLRSQHASYFLDLAERFAAGSVGSSGVAVRTDRLVTEHDNLRAALDWFAQSGDVAGGLRLAGALIRFWYANSHRSEGYRWLERFLATAGDASPAVYALALRGQGMLTVGERSDERAIPPLRASLALWRQVDDRSGIAETLVMLGIKLENVGEYGEAAAMFAEAEALFDGLGVEGWAALAQHHRGVLAYGQGDLVKACALLEESVDRQRRLRKVDADPGWLASALNDLGGVVRQRGDLARSAALHTESLRVWRREGTLEGVADALANLATVATASGRADRAARLFGAAAGLAGSLGYAFELPERADHEQAMHRLRAALGDAAFGAAWSAGAGLPLDDAVALAIDGTGPAGDATRLGPAPPVVTGALSARQIEVLRLVAIGRRDREIARELFISPRTVQTHLAGIFDKLGVGTRAAAVAHAYEHNLI